MNNTITETQIITESFNSYKIRINKENNYLCLTDINKSSSQHLLQNWKNSKKTKEVLEKIAKSLGKPVSDLLYITSGYGGNQGTWAYPIVAIEFANYCSKDLGKAISDWMKKNQYKKEDDVTKKEIKPPEQQDQLEIQSIKISNDLDRELDIIERCLNISNLDPTIIAYLMLDYAKEFYPNIKICVKEYGRVLKAIEEQEQK